MRKLSPQWNTAVSISLSTDSYKGENVIMLNLKNRIMKDFRKGSVNFMGVLISLVAVGVLVILVINFIM